MYIITKVIYGDRGPAVRQPLKEFNSLESEKEWAYGLCDCCASPKLCCLGWFCFPWYEIVSNRKNKKIILIKTLFFTSLECILFTDARVMYIFIFIEIKLIKDF